MARLFDFMLELLKWPIALVTLVSLPALVRALEYFSLNNVRFFSFLAGAGVYVALKVVASARSNVSMQILAHEFTHIFFAFLTFHKVTHIHLNMDESGGSMSFKGKGNWLIVIGPYFFPLFLFILMLGVTFFYARFAGNLWVNGVFGYFFAYHLESIVVQIHGEQPDFHVVGFPFCWVFLPGANLFACSVVLAFNNGGWTGVSEYIEIIYKLDLHNFLIWLSWFAK